ncbi:B12-binding domain-containing radical SAM protein [Bacillus litorisediminis]|uniref:B12-binding domain-containing radical SAM protein n=1 Tax=Bacillus litorisediminis TaxID=2922713 RepID=UPI001FADB792|nr:B12-binding domain-containing radical SAM protein [Bacillus litorisediminis]
MKTVLASLNAKYIHTNLAIRYLKAYAAPEFDIELAEYTIKDPEMNIVTDLYNRKPDIIGFSCYIWNIEETIRVVKMLKKINPHLFIVLGGPEVTYDVPEWLERLPEVDVIALGEGEETFKQLLEALNRGDSLDTVFGIAYINEEGKLKVNPQRNKLDLRSLPSPFRFKEDIPHLSKRVTYIETSRGCPFSCQFCLSSIEVGVRYFDREKIKADIRYLMENGAKTIKFVDRTFNISRSYAMEMFQFLIDEHRPGTVFQFEITGDIMRPEVIDFLNKEAPPGLFRFEIGVQSTNDHTNELVKRRQNFEKLTRTVTMVKQGGKIDQHLDLIAGLPEENYDSFRNTFNDVFALRPEELQLGFLKLLRGTGLRQDAKKYGYVYMEHAPYEMLSNKVLSFAEIIKIKQVEDVLEKYWNDHRMDLTIEYLVQHVYETPFDFFQEFGAFWEKQGWSRIGHQLEDLFKRLNQFLIHQQIEQLSIVQGMMKWDYLTNQRYKPRHSWWKDGISKEEKQQVIHSMAANPSLVSREFAILSLSEKDLFKHAAVERFPFSMEKYLESGEILFNPEYGVIIYNGDKMEKKTFFLSQKKLVHALTASI